MNRAESELRAILERLSPVARQLLREMKPGTSYGPSQLQSLLEKGTKAKAVGAAGWLIANGLVQEVARESRTSRVSLANKGQTLVKSGGLPEGRIVESLRSGKRSTIQKLSEELSLSKEELNPVLGTMKKDGVIAFESGGRVVLREQAAVKRAGERYRSVNKLLEKISKDEPVDWKELDLPEREIIEKMSRKRGKGKAVFRILRQVEIAYELTSDGEDAQRMYKIYDDTSTRITGEIIEPMGSLTPEIMEKELWRDRTFRKYDIATRPQGLTCGRKHPYGLFLDFVRKKLISMGFEEMEGRLIETEFWNNDALFMPQDHPAREIHDVYLVKEPKYSKELPQDLVEKVAKTHEGGWKTGSSGWGYEFDKRRTSQFVLRSQGTANSARMLADAPKVPGKYFAIARCFRYDRVDSTHAPDFYQIEGIVISPGINFRHLLGLLKLFALEIAGSREVKFTPYYFPFTEPSVEIHFKHENLGWMELGGAGIFRKEVTLPLGIDLPVIAWGLGLDRMAMVALSINDIRDLFTPDLGKILKMKFKNQNVNIKKTHQS